MNPGWVRATRDSGARALALVAFVAVALAVAGILLASNDPDGIQKLATARTPRWLHAPLAEYQMQGVDSPWLRRAGAGVAGLVLIYGACVLGGRLLTQRRQP
jgi:hypothetical protein